MADQVRKERAGISAWSRRGALFSPQRLPGFRGKWGGRASLRWVPFLMAAAVLLLRGKPRFAKRLKVSMKSNFVVFSKFKKVIVLVFL